MPGFLQTIILLKSELIDFHCSWEIGDPWCGCLIPNPGVYICEDSLELHYGSFYCLRCERRLCADFHQRLSEEFYVDKLNENTCQSRHGNG